MGRAVKGRMFQRKHVWYLTYTYCGHKNTLSLKTRVKLVASKIFEKEMFLRKAAIFDGTHDQKYNKTKSPQTPINGKVLLVDAWKVYAASSRRPDTGEATMDIYRGQYESFLAWVSESYPLLQFMSEVSDEIAEGFASDLKRRVCGGTFNKYRNFLRLMFRVLSKETKMRSNPWEGIATLRYKQNNRRNFKDDELNAIFTRATGEVYTLCLEGYHMALRLGDACTLLWDEVNMNSREITRVPNKLRSRNGHPVIIPMHDELYKHLKSIKPQKKGKYVCPKMATAYLKSSRGVVRELQSFFKKCGIRLHREGTGKGTGKRAVVEIGFHSLRHTWVSRKSEDGADDASIRAIVGWGSPAMAKHYTHVSSEHLKTVVSGGQSVASILNDEKDEDGATTFEGMSTQQLQKMIASVGVELDRRNGGTT